VKLQKDLREFIESLNSQRVEYLIVGAHALAFHGHPRLTVDIDFFVRPTSENAARLLDALSDFGFALDAKEAATFTRAGMIVQLGHIPNRIDLLTSISGVTFDEAWQGSAEGELDGLPVRFLGLEALLRNKRAAGRSKDIADAETIEKRPPGR
jgi:predicted nucleotidyltransferase